MENTKDLNLYLNTVIKEGLFSNKGGLQFYLETLFEGIDLKNKKVLDIGGGAGVYSFYAAFMDAKKVVCLEPETEGSSSGVTEKFHKLKKLLECNNVEFRTITLQSLEPEFDTFDVLLLHNSINHLNEPACINLLRESKARAIYKEIFANIYSLSNQGARLIICDCSRYNFFQLLKIRNPIAPTIEWNKHQTPEVWSNLLGEAGFVNPIIRWTTINALRNWGRVCTSNKLMAYFLISHFRLTMIKP